MEKRTRDRMDLRVDYPSHFFAYRLDIQIFLSLVDRRA